MMAQPEVHDFTRVFDILSYQRQRYPQRKAVNSFREGNWLGVSIEDIQEKADRVSQWLIDQDFRPGDRVAVIPRMGSPEWLMIDFGCQQCGLVIVPIHPTSSPNDIGFILKETEAKLIIALDNSLFVKASAVLEQNGIKGALYHLERGLEGFFPGLEYTINTSSAALDERKKAVVASDTLVILYTSGTTGVPKGAVLSHHNVVCNIKSILPLFPLDPGKKVLSFLPFSHVFERTSCFAYLAAGVSVYFSHSIDNLAADFRSVRPFFCTSVPRTLERMYDYLYERKEKSNPLAKLLITWALQTGENYGRDREAGVLFRFRLFLARILVLNRWRRGLGGKMQFIAVGAAALRPEIGRLFSAAGILTLAGYGMTEASPFISVNRIQPGMHRFGTVGLPIPGVRIKIDDPNEGGEGEILIQGPNVFREYYKQPGQTAAVLLPDGWFRTGDVGKITDKHFLIITDRKKDIFKTTAGKYIAPQVLETHFVSSPFIVQCLILGFNRPFVAAILVPNMNLLKNWCEEHGVHWTSPTFMVHNIKVVKKIQDEVDRLNENLQGFERVRKFIISDSEWTVDSKELTTSFKPMRAVLLEKYKAELEKLYV